MSHPYFITEIELTEALRAIDVPEGHGGLALIVRRNGGPVAFVMQEVSAKTRVSADQVRDLIGRKLISHGFPENVPEQPAPSPNSHAFPSLTIAVCTKDRTDGLNRCLASLLSLRAHQPRDAEAFEVLVIDNAPSDDKTRRLVASLPGVRYICEPKPGLDFARNRAIQEATGDLLAYIDDDATTDRKWLDGLKEAWAENPEAAAFTGPVLPYELETKAQILFELTGGFGHGFQKIRYGQTLPGFRLYPFMGILGAGCNMVFRRDALLTLGGFDEALDTGAPLPGGGDLDIFRRVIRGRYLLVHEPQLMVYHQHRRDYRDLRYQIYTWGLSCMAHLMKSCKTDPSQRSLAFRTVAWWFIAMSQQLGRSLLRRFPWPPDIILAQMLGSIIGLCGEYDRSQKRTERIRKQHS